MTTETGSNGAVTLTVDDGVAELRLANPETLNAFRLELVQDLEELVLSLGDGADVRAVAITAEGRAFCAGADTAVVDGPQDTDLAAHYDPAFEWLINEPVPVVVGARRYAIGAGASLLTYVPDLSVVDPDIEIWWPEIDYGLLPRRATAMLYPEIGAKHTTELMLLGERGKLTGIEARELGLVNRVVAGDEVDETARSTARVLADHEAETGLVSEYMDLIGRVRRDATGAGRDFARWRRRRD